MAEQVPSVGRVVHFVHGDAHYAALITAQSSRADHWPEGPDGPMQRVVGQTLVVFPPMEPAFTTVASYDPDGAPATWHWLKCVPAKER
jgi:hypothetical protein